MKYTKTITINEYKITIFYDPIADIYGATSETENATFMYCDKDQDDLYKVIITKIARLIQKTE